MTTTDYIVQYAAQQRGPFRKKDLTAWLESLGAPVGSGLQTQLERLVASGRLVKSGWGEYQLSDNAKPRLQLTLKPETKEMAQYLKQRYPLADFCIWDAASVIPFMLNVPNIKMIIVDVERLLQQSFPDAIREKYPNMIVLPNPTKEEFIKFGSTKDTIVLHTLTTEAPIDKFEGLPIPTAEKLLVDCHALDGLADVCRTLFETYRTEIRTLDGRNVAVYDRAMGNKYFYVFFDLKDLLREAGATDSELASLQAALDEVLVYEAHTKRFITVDLSRCCGLAPTSPPIPTTSPTPGTAPPSSTASTRKTSPGTPPRSS